MWCSRVSGVHHGAPWGSHTGSWRTGGVVGPRATVGHLMGPVATAAVGRRAWLGLRPVFPAAAQSTPTIRSSSQGLAEKPLRGIIARSRRRGRRSVLEDLDITAKTWRLACGSQSWLGPAPQVDTYSSICSQVQALSERRILPEGPHVSPKSSIVNGLRVRLLVGSPLPPQTGSIVWVAVD